MRLRSCQVGAEQSPSSPTGRKRPARQKPIPADGRRQGGNGIAPLKSGENRRQKADKSCQRTRPGQRAGAARTRTSLNSLIFGEARNCAPKRALPRGSKFETLS